MSRDRLARRVRAEVADVRVRLEEAVLRSDALYATGQPERAAAVLDEQHALLAELQDTIASAVAAASVEAEAEAVLFGSPAGVAVFAPEEEAPTPAPRRVRATAGAVASAVAVLALLILGAPTPSPTTMAAVDTDDVTEDRSDDPLEGGSVRSDLSSSGGASGDPTDGRTIGPNEREVRSLFRSLAPSSHGDDDTLGVGSSLSELQEFVDQFVASVVRAAGGLASADAPAEGEELDPRRSQASDDEQSVILHREPVETESSSPDRPADASERDTTAADRAEERDEEHGADDDGEPGLPLPSEDGNAANPGFPGLPE